jgi:hypothetical protein
VQRLQEMAKQALNLMIRILIFRSKTHLCAATISSFPLGCPVNFIQKEEQEREERGTKLERRKGIRIVVRLVSCSVNRIETRDTSLAEEEK